MNRPNRAILVTFELTQLGRTATLQSMKKISLSFAMLLAVAVQTAAAHAESPAVAPNAAAAGKVAPAPASPASPAPVPMRVVAPMPAKPVGKPGISFAYTAPTVGSVETRVDELIFDMVVDANGKKIKLQNKHNQKYTVKTLVAANNKVSKVEVTYASVAENNVTDGKAVKSEEVNSGKAYWVEVNAAGKLTITSTKGEKVSDPEVTIVSKDFDDGLTNIPRMSRIIMGKSWVLKQKTAMTAADFAILNEKPDAPVGSDGFITLMSKNAKTSVFVVEMAAVMKNARFDYTLPGMRLEAIIDNSTLRPIQLKMTSKIKGTANNLPVEGAIKGMRVSKLML